MTQDWQPMSPACMKCEQVTGKSTCFPGPCVFYHERNTTGTKAHDIATLDRIRRGMREPIYASAIENAAREIERGDHRALKESLHG